MILGLLVALGREAVVVVLVGLLWAQSRLLSSVIRDLIGILIPLLFRFHEQGFSPFSLCLEH